MEPHAIVNSSAPDSFCSARIMSKGYSHKDKLHGAKPRFSIEADKQITIGSCNEKSQVNSLPSVPWEGHEDTFQEQ